MTSPPRFLAPLLVLALVTTIRAADIVAGNVTTALGPDFFFDDAATGGSDNTVATFTRDISGYWAPGASVTLKGLGWASPGSNTTATSATVTFTDSGADNAFGTADDVVVGTITNALTFSGASEYVWDFDSDVVFTASASSLRIRIVGNGNISRKTVTGNTTQAAVKLSLAGTAVGGTPPAVQNTATASGFWDSISWNTGSTTSTGGVNNDDSVLIGQHRTVTYRGTPANETLAALNLGDTAPNIGQGTLKVTSGTLTVTGALTAGRDDSANDSFVIVEGGTLHIGGNASFGRSTDSCDGSLIVAGGTVTVGGNLAMGGFEQGGSMLRFHNPGSSPPVGVGGTLTLGRCALDLTFDAGYTHVPGSVITLATFAARDGQFVNFRQGEEFNCGKNRFRIGYSSSSITLTALQNWTAPAGRPNIILLFADDGGYADLGMQGATKFPTPRINSLATSGVRFTDHYMTGGVCHPSRCGLLAGTYQQRFGTDNNLGDANSSHDGMAVDQATIPNRLQGLGYRTYGIGKWHLGRTVEFHPNCRGFDRWYGIWGGSRSFYDVGTTEHTVFQDQMTPDFAAENTAYVTDRIGDKAVSFINEHLASSNASEPFFMYVSFTAIHAPMDIKTTDPRFARLQSEFGLTAASYSNSSPLFGGSTQSTVDANRYELAAMTLAMDEQVGKILDKLNTAGISNNTLVVYTNDNGGAGWNSSSGGNFSYNTPLRGYKGSSLTDGSIRVPAAARWPGTIPAGQTIADPVISLDWGATFVNATGNAPVAARNGLDGLDLMPRLRNGTPLPADRALFWRMGGNTGGGSAARIGDWKMLIADPGGAPQLYNLRSDIDENNNLASAQPAILGNLLERFRSWESRTLPPLYGSADTVIDAGLEYHATGGGLRLKNATTTPLWLSSSLRSPISLASDFAYSFLIRASEAGPHGTGAGIWHGLGDSSNRAQFIRAGINFNNSTLVLSEGKSGQSAAVPLPSLPTNGFATAVLEFRAATRQLTLSVGATSIALTIPVSYASLTHTAMAAAKMEGELTVLRPTTPGGPVSPSAAVISPSGNPVFIDLDLGNEPPFAPRMERASGLTGFTPEPEALVETLGGGLYRVTAPASGLPREFFRFRSDQP